MHRLEEIVEALEGGDRPLDDVVVMFEEGIRLSSECLEYLGKTELRLKKLSRYGILDKIAYPESPPRVEYRLTEFGQRFSALLDEIEHLEKSLGDSSTHRP